MSNHERFQQMYDADETPPWDSGIVPPEVRRLVEGESPLNPGRAVDIGCGTGTSSVYLARNGWTVTGVDWVDKAVEQARVKAQNAGLSESQVCFLQGDAAAPDLLAEHPPVDLWLDIGCLHGFSAEQRRVYAGHAVRLVKPGATLLLYMWGRYERDGQPRGMDEPDVVNLFAPHFEIIQIEQGEDTANRDRTSAWYTLQRQAAI